MVSDKKKQFIFNNKYGSITVRLIYKRDKMVIIDQEIKLKSKNFAVAVIEFAAEVFANPKIDDLITSTEKEIAEKYDLADCLQIPNILSGRNAYKSYGKDPSRYRLAVESLYRRLVKGNDLYRVNNLVDVGNVLSIKVQKSVAVLDRDKIIGDVFIRLGNDYDEYYGIGRGKLNVEKIPLYEDLKGPFGSTTSDTERTMITKNTKNCLVFIVSFNGVAQLEEDIKLAKNLFADYCLAKNFKSYTVE